MKYLHISPWRVWLWMFNRSFNHRRVGIFRNLPNIKPGRWGFFVYGFEIGSRNPQDKIGVWLKENGLWPW